LNPDETQWLVTLCPCDGFPKRILWLVWAVTEAEAHERALSKLSGPASVIQTECLFDLPDDAYIATYDPSTH